MNNTETAITGGTNARTVAKELMTETPLAKGLGIYEIAEDTTIEEMKAIFWDSKALVAPAYKLFQLNTHGKRFYYFYDEKGRPVFMPSVTTILAETMPENPFLTDWKLSMGKEKAEAYTAERAAYGTFMHGCFEELIINRRFNLDTMRGKLALYVHENKLPDKFMNYAEDLKRDVLSFAQWIRDYDVKPVAVEVALYHPTEGYAGMIDLVASVRDIPVAGDEKMLNKAMDAFNKAMDKAVANEAKAIEKAEAEFDKAREKAKGDEEAIQKANDVLCAKTKEAEQARLEAIKAAKADYNTAKKEVRKNAKRRTLGIVDFKSGRKGFYEEHQHQLNLYKKMWNENFPRYKVKFIANFSPKDWRKAPTYNYKDQTEEQPMDKTMLFLELYKMNKPAEKNVTVLSGTINLDSPVFGLENISVVALEDLVSERDISRKRGVPTSQEVEESIENSLFPENI